LANPEDDDPVGGAQIGPDLVGQFSEQGLVIPGGGADEVLEAVAVEVVAVGDRLGVLAFQVGDEPGAIGMGMASLLVADQASGERLDEVNEAFDDPVEGLGSEVAFGEELLLAEFKSLLHRSISQEKGSRWKAIVQNSFGCLQCKVSVIPFGPLALPPVRDYNGRHAGSLPDLLA
jgi:hypothetical protein